MAAINLSAYRPLLAENDTSCSSPSANVPTGSVRRPAGPVLPPSSADERNTRSQIQKRRTTEFLVALFLSAHAKEKENVLGNSSSVAFK